MTPLNSAPTQTRTHHTSGSRRFRVVALVASYNERRFIEPCLAHLHGQGIETYLIDNCSTDDTVEIAERNSHLSLIGIEQYPHEGVYDWTGLLKRKEELARELDADWFIHLDPDEIRLPPDQEDTLATALRRVDEEGFNAVNFVEFTFLPTRESPDHDHRDFQRTLRTYYPFAPRFPNQLKAWKATAEIDLASSGGHRASFPDLKMYPQSFPMKHYLFLSLPHAIEKYGRRSYARREVEGGWHGWRARLNRREFKLPSRSELRVASVSQPLDASEPRRRHYVDEMLDSRLGGVSATLRRASSLLRGRG